ncbi:MAG: hypothetical protein KZQ70_11770 [gamma proteobacterium symbiont of Lucinoma myriamae]|nr:hypothetical protein [gamma proteobacterium symbiont of Lucinoma myriamae]MCU7818521.1 hypothetical protein [gamma proteobacterium symbiont of Lucinoma myriamae]MCU7833110.1 hypothetical protein [gamma proteobacterium symbiont of Lucinoma myriamae]
MYSVRTYRHLISFYLVFFGLLITQQTFAEDIVTNEGLQKKMVKTKSIDQGGFIFDIQKVDPLILAMDVQKLRGAYIKHQHKLTQLVENKKLNAGDAIITILIPDSRWLVICWLQKARI